MMPKAAKFILAGLAALFWLVPRAAMADIANPIKQGELQGSNMTLEVAIDKILPIVVGVAGVILVIVLIIGGVMYITSGGNEEGANKAKKLILDAIIGMVIVAVAYLIARYVVHALTGAEKPTLGTPTITGPTGPPGPQPTPEPPGT